MSLNNKANNKIDRTTRFIATITLFGGAWFLLKNTFLIWINTFSQIAYAKTILNVEHIIAILLFAVTLVITGFVLRYLFLELKTYQFYKKVEEEEQALKNADDSFNSIFSIIKYLVNILFITLIIFLIIFILSKDMILYISIGLVAGLVIFLFTKIISKRKLNSFEFFDKIQNKMKPYLIILYIIILLLFFGITIMLLSIEGNKTVNIELKDTANLPLNIIIENFQKPEIYLKIYRESEETVYFKYNENELMHSFMEVLQPRNDISKNLKSHEIDKILKEVNSYNINQYEYTHKFNKELKEYILEGHNTIEIIIISNGEKQKKAFHFVTSILKKDDEVYITKNNINVKL